MGSNSRTNSMVIVAIPDENDRVWKISSEQIPHLTLLFLGDADKVTNPESIVQFVEHAADRSLNRFYLPVDRRDELGADKADVLFFKRGRYDFKAVQEFRGLLLKDDNIKTAYDSTSQFEFPDHVGAAGQEWIPHLTLGYPDSPAKPIPDDQLSAIYDVSFNKIAVWMGNYDGPEFMLKDYWDEMDDMDSPALAMANNTRKAMGLDAALEHFGVKGMRWGVRNETISVNGKTQQVTARQAKKADKDWKKDFHQLKTFGFDDQKFTKEYNAKWKDDFSKEDWSNPSPRYQAYQDGYFKEMERAYQKQIVDHYGSSPTGKMRIEKTDRADEIKLVHNPSGGRAKHDALEHADGDIFVRAYKVILDDNGLIKGVEPVEKEKDLAQTADLGVEFLEHYGVKGMRWGVRNETVSGAAKTVGSGAKTAAKGVGKAAVSTAKFVGDVNFENRVENGRAREAVISNANKEFHKTDLPAIKAKPEHQKAAKLKNRLLNPRDPGTKAYRKEVRETYINRLESTANSMKNPSGNREYTIRERGIDLPARGGALPTSKYFWDVSARDVKHTADEVLALDYTRLEVEMDDDGWITGVKFATEDETLEQTTDLGAAFLSHYGVKGMRWGVRNEAPSAVTPTAKSVVPHGDKRKTRIKVEGGQNHPASTDAIRVAQAHEKLKKSGVKALSNQELQDVQNRLNLERNVKQLTAATTTVGRGRQFVKGLTGFGKDINEPLRTGIDTARLVKQLG